MYIPERDENGDIIQPVVTEMERDNKTLGLVSAEAQFIDGIARARVPIPGPSGSFTRFVKEGYGFTDRYIFGLRVTSVRLVDEDFLYAGVEGFYPATPFEAGIPGTEGMSWADIMPDGVELGSYTDPAMPVENQGWRMWAEEGGQGGCDIDNLAGYGNLPGRTVMLIDAKIPEGATGELPTIFAVDLQWGTPK